MRRTRNTTVIAALVAATSMLMANLALAAELVVAELDGTTNQVTVQQGATSQSFNISLTATGRVACGSSHTAEMHTVYSISATGAVTSNTLSSPKAFTSSTCSGDGNVDITWPGAPIPQTVSASVSVNSATPTGTYTVTLKEDNNNTRTTSSNTNGGKLEDETATTVTFTVTAATLVAPTNTPPTVAVSGVTDGSSYEIGSVPSATCNVVDAEDGNSSFAATLSAVTGSLSTYGLGSQTASCSYTDAGGLNDTDSATYSIVDTGNPTITDLGATPASHNGSNGWYTSAVTNTFRASDSGGGFLSPLTNPYTFTQSSGTNEGSAITIGSGSISDVAGNTSSINSATFKIDLSNPTNVQFSGGPAAGSSHYFDSVPAAPTCTADDSISLLASCVVTGYSTAVGTHTLTATATDNAGRTATAQRTYTVLAWTLSGFYSPVEMNGILNSAKSGSTVPLKFEVSAGTELTDTTVVDSFKVGEVPCGALSTLVTDDIENYTSGGTSLRYDTTGGQFIQNWQTPKGKAGACYRVALTTDDASSATAYFKLK